MSEPQTEQTAPAPASGDVVAKLAEIRLRYSDRLSPRLLETVGASLDEWRAIALDAVDDIFAILPLTDRIATLEQERAARDAECERLRMMLTKISIKDPCLGDDNTFGDIARRALGDQG